MWGRAQAGKEERKRKGPLALSPTWIKGATPPNGGKKYSLNKEHEKEISVYLKNHKYAYIYIYIKKNTWHITNTYHNNICWPMAKIHGANPL